jgi:hypothetical protein
MQADSPSREARRRHLMKLKQSALRSMSFAEKRLNDEARESNCELPISSRGVPPMAAETTGGTKAWPTTPEAKKRLANARILDLCDDDKSRIAKLIQQVVTLGDEKQALQQQLEEQGIAYTSRLDRLKEQNGKIIQETANLRSKFNQSLRLLQTYQQRLMALKGGSCEKHMLKGKPASAVVVDENIPPNGPLTARENHTSHLHLQVDASGLGNRQPLQTAEAKKIVGAVGNIGQPREVPAVPEELMLAKEQAEEQQQQQQQQQLAEERGNEQTKEQTKEQSQEQSNKQGQAEDQAEEATLVLRLDFGSIPEV